LGLLGYEKKRNIGKEKVIAGKELKSRG